MTKKYPVHWLTVGESKVPIAFDGVEHRVLIRLFAQQMMLVTDQQRRLVLKYAEKWDIRGIRTDEDEALRNEPSLPARYFDAYLWRINDPVNQGAKSRLDQVRYLWRQAFLDRFAPETPDSPGAQRIASALATAVAAKDQEIAELKAKVARLEMQIGGYAAFLDTNPGRRVGKGATRTLGPKEFEQIRDPQAAGVSDEEMAARVLASAGSVRQIRDGRYPSRTFDDWMRSQGIEPKTTFDTNQREARRTWGYEVPDWVLALALACDHASQGKVADRMGVSRAVVNLVLKRKYKGRYDRIELRVLEEFCQK